MRTAFCTLGFWVALAGFALAALLLAPAVLLVRLIALRRPAPRRRADLFDPMRPAPAAPAARKSSAMNLNRNNE